MNKSRMALCRRGSDHLLFLSIISLSFFLFALLTFWQLICRIQNSNWELDMVNPEIVSDSIKKDGMKERHESSMYYYQQLSGDEKDLYIRLYFACIDMEEVIVLEPEAEDMLHDVFYSMMYDHPELFYIDGYSSEEYSYLGIKSRIEFHPNYTMPKEEAKESMELVESAAANWLTAKPEKDMYLDLQNIYEKLLKETSYQSDAANGQNILSVFLEGNSVCAGYARAFQYLCQQRGIQALYVTGEARVNGAYGSHAWVVLNLEESFYHVDPTWGDLDDRIVNYDYFLVSDETICETHLLKNEIPVPKCEDDSLSYYNVYDLRINSEKELEERLGDKRNKLRIRDGVLQLQVAPGCYQSVLEYLADEGKPLLDEMLGEGECIYVSANDLLGTIRLWKEGEGSAPAKKGGANITSNQEEK